MVECLSLEQGVPGYGMSEHSLDWEGFVIG